MKTKTEISSLLPFAIIIALLLAACSTTSRLPQGETLYTGVDEFKVVAADGEPVRCARPCGAEH